ncbi:protein of unknown function [Thauera humireducens]|nr:protein of unknown function [Thauera humireducens]
MPTALGISRQLAHETVIESKVSHGVRLLEVLIANHADRRAGRYWSRRGLSEAERSDGEFRSRRKECPVRRSMVSLPANMSAFIVGAWFDRGAGHPLRLLRHSPFGPGQSSQPSRKPRPL